MISPYFVVQEFVPKAIYDVYGDRSIMFIDERIVQIAEYIRVGLGKPVTINNWHTGGQYSESGFRLPDTKTGGRLSQHKSGRAIDVKVAGLSVAEVYSYVVDNFAELHELGLTTVEDINFTPTWLHLDCRWTGKSTLLIVKP